MYENGYNVEPKWKEECGVYGVFSRTEDVSGLTYLGLYALQHRGQESAGIAITDGAWMDVTRGMGLVNEVFRHQVPGQPAHEAAIHMEQIPAAGAHHVEMGVATVGVLHVLILGHALHILILAHAALFRQQFQIPVHRGSPHALAPALHLKYHVVHREVGHAPLL